MEKHIIHDGIKANDGIKAKDRIKANDDITANDDTTANDELNRRRRRPPAEKFKSYEETSPSSSWSSSSSESSSLPSSVKNRRKMKPIVTNEATGKIHGTKKKNYVFYALRAACRMIGIPQSLCCRIGTNYDAHCPSPGWPANSRAMTMTGTLFGYRKGRMHWALQEDTRSAPGLLLELATPTSALVREMASGMVRIALECPRAPCRGAPRKLLEEPVWTMYCNGHKSGYAHRVGPCSYGGSWHALALSMVGAVSMGAGVLPLAPPVSSPRTGKNLIDNGNDKDNDNHKPGNDTDKDNDNDHVDGVACDQLMYMRARFERVVGNCDSEAYYMMNPDRTSGPELSVFLVRV